MSLAEQALPSGRPPSPFYTEEHEAFRSTVRRFVEREIMPHVDQWDEAEEFPRDLYRKASAAGLMQLGFPEAYGGVPTDPFFGIVKAEEMARHGSGGLNASLNSHTIGSPPIAALGPEWMKRKVLPEVLAGEKISALAITEPSGGSDVANLKTTARREGDHYVVNGSKTFITNGFLADLVIVVAKTDPKAGAKGISLFVVEAGTPGFSKGKRLEKVGMKAQDTSELFFQDVRIPRENLLGKDGQGFIYLMQELPQERLTVGIGALASAEAALQWTLDYTRERKAFGKSVADFQNTRFKLAEMATEIQVGRVFVDRCMEQHLQGKLDVPTAAMCKYWTTDLQCKVLDECVQLHGGYGFMWEYPVARAWADARVQRIYAGTNEIMKEIIARAL